MTDQTAAAVLGNIEAMAFAVGQLSASARLTADDVLAVHERLFRHTDQRSRPGHVRTEQSWIGGNDYNPCGAEFVPPPPEAVESLLDDLVAFLNTDRYPPLVQAALAHAQFETIHPFADGNGRVGRALIHVVLRRRGLARRYVPPISLILATCASEYVAGLTAYRYVGDPASGDAQRGVGRWITTFASAASRAAADAQRLGRQVDELVRRWRQEAAPVRRRSAADLLLSALPAAPIVTVATAANLIGRSVPQTNAAVARLAATGVLKQTTVGRRNRAFQAQGVVEALTDFERSLASPTGDTRTSLPARRVPKRVLDHA